MPKFVVASATLELEVLQPFCLKIKNTPFHPAIVFFKKNLPQHDSSYFPNYCPIFPAQNGGCDGCDPTPRHTSDSRAPSMAAASDPPPRPSSGSSFSGPRWCSLAVA